MVPEVLQTASMDCGPTVLKCMLEGYGISARMDDLRDLCSTDVDGTSIDALEEVANRIGFPLRQFILPKDLIAGTNAGLPAITFKKLSDGALHFIVLWSTRGEKVQIMDPAAGRSWTSRERITAEVHEHEMTMPAGDWRLYAEQSAFVRMLGERTAGLLGQGAADSLVARALSDTTHVTLAALDAAVRMVSACVVHGVVRGRGEAVAAVEKAVTGALAADDMTKAIPPVFWSVDGGRGAEELTVRGAVVLSVDAEGVSASAGEVSVSPAPGVVRVAGDEQDVLRRILAVVASSSRSLVVPFLASLALLSVGVLLEAVVLQAAFSMDRLLPSPTQRVAAVLFVVGIFVLTLVLEATATSLSLRMGRRIEIFLRRRVLEKLPRVGDAYFRTRLLSDFGERAYQLHQTQALSELAREFLSSGCELLVVLVAITFMAPTVGAVFAVILVVFGLLVRFGLLRVADADLRARTHGGAMVRLFLDVLSAIPVVRAHSAEPQLENEFEGRLRHWAGAVREYWSALTVYRGLEILAGVVLMSAIVVLAVGGSHNARTFLLVYWTLRTPALISRFAGALSQYPHVRSVVLRLFELLDAPELERIDTSPSAPRGDATTEGCAVVFENVSVRIRTNTLISEASLSIKPGEHVAIVGVSGAGKSTLLGLLLGWFQATEGVVRVDGEVLGAGSLPALRQRTAWLDPGVHLWNQSLLENILFGSPAAPSDLFAEAVSAAEIGGILDQGAQGMSLPVGEGGRLLSGGEGQRVRFARALLHPSAQLVLLDEPFRGLPRERRESMLRRARTHWAKSTLFCVTHDVGEAATFDRIVVVADGRIVENGTPDELARNPQSSWRALAELEKRSPLHAGALTGWTLLDVNGGRITEGKR